jgi:multiple sugar transport system substrate-binding protein
MAGRRDLLRAAAFSAAAAAGVHVAACKKRGRKTLRILQRTHFVPAYDAWFSGKYAREWGEKHDVDVVVDTVDTASLDGIAAGEQVHRRGHDLIAFPWPRPFFEADVIDHAEIYQECERRYGKALPLAIRSTYNPRTNKYFGFSDHFAPDPINWRKDLFDEVGGRPEAWDGLRTLGSKILEKRGIAVGIGLANEIDSAMALRAVLYSFGASEQDEEGNLVLASKETLEAVKYVRALYREAMLPEVLSWDASSNNHAMLAGRISAAVNGVSITREAEEKEQPVGDRIRLAKPAVGSVRGLGLPQVMNAYFIWNFAESIDAAKQFLVDYVGSSRDAFLASGFYDFPCYPTQVPDMVALLQRDGRASPSDKYAVLTDCAEWTTNVGYPGCTNAAVDDAFASWVLNTMFAQAATDAVTPEEAVRDATKRYQAIWAKWQDRKLL